MVYTPPSFDPNRFRVERNPITGERISRTRMPPTGRPGVAPTTPTGFPKASPAFLSPALKDLAEVRQRNVASRMDLLSQRLGVPERAASEPGFLSKAVGKVDWAATAVMSSLDNIFRLIGIIDANRDAGDNDWVIGDKNFYNPLLEAAKAWKGEENLDFSDITTEMGWEPESTGGKVLKFVVDMAGEVAFDPLTYLSFGWSSATRSAARGTIKGISRTTGMISKEILEEAAPKLARQYADEAGELSLKSLRELGSEVESEFFEGLLRREGRLIGDKGGIAIRNILARKTGGRGYINIAGPESLAARGAAAVRTKVKALPVIKPITRLLSTEQRYMQKADLGPISAIVAAASHTTFGRIAAAWRVTAHEADVLLSKELPKKAHEMAVIALQQSAKPKVFIDDIYKRGEDIIKGVDEKTLTAGAGPGRQAPEQLQQLFRLKGEADIRLATGNVDWGVFKRQLKLLEPDLSTEEINRSVIAMKKWQQGMLDLHGVDIAAGIKTPFRADYVPGRAGITPEKTARKISEVYDVKFKPSVTEEAIKPAARRVDIAGEGFIEQQKLSIVEALQRGSGREVRAGKLLEIRTRESGMAHAAKEAKEQLASVFGEFEKWPAWVKTEYDNITKPLQSLEDIKEFAGFWNKVSGLWRLTATVMNPGFFMRNAQSNVYLIYTKLRGTKQLAELPRSLQDGINLAKAVHFGGEPELYKKFAGGLGFDNFDEFKIFMREHGVVGGRVQEAHLQSLLSTTSRKGKGLIGTLADNPYTNMMGKINATVEDSARLAAFEIGMKQYRGDVFKSVEFVNKTLYDYIPESLTGLERSTRSVIPFYTWIRRNLPEMIDVALHQPAKLLLAPRAQKVGEAVFGDVDWDIIPDYMQEQTVIPIEMGGHSYYVNPNWGFQDIEVIGAVFDAAGGDFDPLVKDVIGRLNPLIKVPFELYGGKDFFFGAEIEAYPGEKTELPYYFQAFEMTSGGNPAWEALKDRIGVETRSDNRIYGNAKFNHSLKSIPFLKNIDNLLEAVLDTDAPIVERRRSYSRMVSFLSGVKTYYGEEERWALNREYEDRSQLYDYLERAKDEERGPYALQRFGISPN